MPILSLLLTLLVLVLVLGVVFWILVTYVAPALPEPFRRFFIAICGLIAVIVILMVLLPGGLGGGLQIGAPLLILGGLAAAPSRAPDPLPAATITPASAAVDQTNAWLQGAKRILMPAIAIAPFVIDAVLEMVNVGTIEIPKQYLGAWAIIVLVIQLHNKARLSQEAQAQNTRLAGQGLPVGVPLSAPVLERALFTESKLPVPTP